MIDKNVHTTLLISIIHKKHAKYLNEKVKDDDLSFGLYPLLINIYRQEGVIQEQLAQNLYLNESTITRNLKKLEDKGFIKRIPYKRTKRIGITEKGEKTAKKVMDYDNQWDDKIKEIIGEETYPNFKDTLIKISKEII